MRGISEQYKFTKEGNLSAIQLYRKAVELDPENSSFRTGLGWALQAGARLGFHQDPKASTDEAQSICNALLAMKNVPADVYALQGYIFTNESRFDEAKAFCKEAIEQQPSVSLSHAMLAIAYNSCGEFEESLNSMRKAIRLSPYSPDWYFSHLGDAYRGLGQLEQARTVYRHLETRLPGTLLCQIRLAAIHADLDDTENATNAVDAVLSIDPQFSVQTYTGHMVYKTEALRKFWADAMLKAGLPE